MTSDKTQLAAEIIGAEIDDLMTRVDALQRARDILLGVEQGVAIETSTAAQLPPPVQPASQPVAQPGEDDGETDLQDRLLELLSEYHGERITNATMARALGILPASVTQVLNALEEDGAIRREGSTHSRRIYVTALDGDEDDEAEDEEDEEAPITTAHPVEPPMPMSPAASVARRDPLAPPPLPSEGGARR